MDSNEFARTVVFQNDLVEPVPKFYVVSPKKFLLLFIMTLGVYEVFWFYQNWQNFKLYTKQNMWPIARGIFSILFAHKLFDAVNKTLITKNSTHQWSPSTLATVFVVFSIIARVIDRQTPEEGVNAILGFVLGTAASGVVCWVLYQAQLAVNIACDDPDGQSNRELTSWNWIWILLGGLAWAAILISFYIILTLT